VNKRIGVCNVCRTVESITHLHHDKYDSTDYQAYTLEVCPSCHQMVHTEQKKEHTSIKELKFESRVKRAGNSGAITVPRQWIGKRVWAEIRILENGDEESQ
jgi:putative transposon-encoded protein